MSSSKAEYHSMSFALKELKCLNELLTYDFGITVDATMELFCDSKSTIHIAANLVFHKRNKHIEQDSHSIRDAFQDNLTTTEHINTKEQPADLLTKALPSIKFSVLTFQVGDSKHLTTNLRMLLK